MPRIDWYMFPTDHAGWITWLIAIIGIGITLWIASGPWMAILGVAVGIAGYSIDHHTYIPYAVLIASTAFVLTRRHVEEDLTLAVILRQGMYLFVGYLLYEMGRKWAEGSEEIAVSNSHRVLDFERRMGMNFEPWLQQQVLRSNFLVHLFTRIYSAAFLPFVILGLVWFLLSNQREFVHLRNALGISALLSVLTFRFFPVAPPRLVPDANVIDLHEYIGKSHSFVNSFAAVPSLHVGWMMLVGYFFFRSWRGNRWSWVAWMPGLIMFVTVIVTGNHYWFDGFVGMAYTLIPAVILANWTHITAWWARWLALPPKPYRLSMVESIRQQQWARFSTCSLSSLLFMMIVGEIFRPGFTNYWGYMVAQIAATILTIAWFSQRFAPEGGLSWATNLIIVAVSFADTLGTAAGFYSKYDFYDKITHFFGGAILAAVMFELLYVLSCRGAIHMSTWQLAAIGILTAFTLGGVWEIYEVLGDALFDTGRNAGRFDTAYDLISDTSGGIFAVVMLTQLSHVFLRNPNPNAVFGAEPIQSERLA